MPIEEQGDALLLRDLLSLHRTFRYRRYRTDILGFLASWALVAVLVGLYAWLATWGA